MIAASPDRSVETYPGKGWGEGVKLNDLIIGTRLACGFGLFVLVLTALGLFSIYISRSLHSLTRKLYRDPCAVCNNVQDIQLHIIAMHQGMKDVLLAEDRR